MSTLSGETDALTFGANVDLDEAGNLGNPFGNQDPSAMVAIKDEMGVTTLQPLEFNNAALASQAETVYVSAAGRSAVPATGGGDVGTVERDGRRPGGGAFVGGRR